MLDDGIDATALKILEQTELAFELGFESLEDYLLYLENEKENGGYKYDNEC